MDWNTEKRVDVRSEEVFSKNSRQGCSGLARRTEMRQIMEEAKVHSPNGCMELITCHRIGRIFLVKITKFIPIGRLIQ